MRVDMEMDKLCGQQGSPPSYPPIAVIITLDSRINMSKRWVRWVSFTTSL